MNLVYEENGSLSVQLAPLSGFLDYLSQVGDAGTDGRHRAEVGIGGAGDDVSQGGLATARRSPEDD